MFRIITFLGYLYGGNILMAAEDAVFSLFDLYWRPVVSLGIFDVIFTHIALVLAFYLVAGLIMSRIFKSMTFMAKLAYFLFLPLLSLLIGMCIPSV